MVESYHPADYWKERAEKAEAELGMRVSLKTERDALKLEVERLREEVTALRLEKHASGSAPTGWAYEQACAALEKHRARADKAEAQVAQLRAVLDAGTPCHCTQLRAALVEAKELADDIVGHTRLCLASVKKDPSDCNCWSACAALIDAALASAPAESAEEARFESYMEQQQGMRVEQAHLAREARDLAVAEATLEAAATLVEGASGIWLGAIAKDIRAIKLAAVIAGVKP